MVSPTVNLRSNVINNEVSDFKMPSTTIAVAFLDAVERMFVEPITYEIRLATVPSLYRSEHRIAMSALKPRP